MTKITLTAAAVLISMGTAFADHDPAPANVSQSAAANVDSTVTASIKKSDVAVQKLEARGSDRNLFGR
ncbi:hypothetical protein M2281_003821 [Mesorhizobium soli]|jgi:hypothetical protein|uniref:DUF680 domain-containing protein n=1 Tax=Pseudaminobacter soli (ex Li et al. 2025) TaxID=1295366 RepID=UPI002472F54C|nr:DUF680 domain-containing protein [Mesorhizobium soli]MDH6233210.1 hypothetical protein [Mesorhizobium soli]